MTIGNLVNGLPRSVRAGGPTGEQEDIPSGRLDLLVKAMSVHANG